MSEALEAGMFRGLAKRAYRALVGTAITDDPVRAWKGTAREDLSLLRVMHVGDCSIRAMDKSHDVKAPVGYPKVAAERLLDDGIGIEFAHYFAITYEYLPEIERLERVTKLSGAPDVVLIHTGATYQRRVMLKSNNRINQLRVEIARRFGRGVFLPYRFLVRPLVRLFGRHWNPYNGTELLDRFIGQVEEAWPEAQIVLIGPFPNSWIYPTSGPIIEDVLADARELADRRDLPFLHFESVGGTDGIHCCNGYNLNARGSEIVGEELAQWIFSEVAHPVAVLRAA